MNIFQKGSFAFLSLREFSTLKLFSCRWRWAKSATYFAFSTCPKALQIRPWRYIRPRFGGKGTLSTPYGNPCVEWLVGFIRDTRNASHLGEYMGQLKFSKKHLVKKVVGSILFTVCRQYFLLLICPVCRYVMVCTYIAVFGVLWDHLSARTINMFIDRMDWTLWRDVFNISACHNRNWTCSYMFVLYVILIDCTVTCQHCGYVGPLLVKPFRLYQVLGYLMVSGCHIKSTGEN